MGFEPVFVIGLSSVLKKLCAHAEVVDINNPTEEILHGSLNGYVLITKEMYLKFQHCFINNPNYKIIVMFDDVENGMLADFGQESIVAYFTYSVDVSEIEFGLSRILLGHKYISQNVLQDVLPNIVLNKKPFVAKEKTLNKLSKSETAIFKHLENGLSNKEIYSITGLKPSTISTYKKRIFEKFNTKSIVKINSLLNN